MTLSWDVYLDREIEAHMGGEDEDEEPAPRCTMCRDHADHMVTLDGDPWCRPCAVALLPELTVEERAETVAALEVA